jgi:hypothetical protein
MCVIEAVKRYKRSYVLLKFIQVSLIGWIKSCIVMYLNTQATGIISMSTIKSRVQLLGNASPNAKSSGHHQDTNCDMIKDARPFDCGNSTRTIFKVRTSMHLAGIWHTRPLMCYIVE